MIIPKHIVEKDPVNALKTQVVGTGPFRLKEPPTSTLVKYERNPDYFLKGLPYLDEIDLHLIDDSQALAAAILSKRVFWNDSFSHPNLDGDLAQSMVKQNANLVHARTPSLAIAYFTMQTTKPPFDDLRVRQALSEAIRREAFAELGKQTGVVGTGNYPLSPWAMPREMFQQEYRKFKRPFPPPAGVPSRHRDLPQLAPVGSQQAQARAAGPSQDGGAGDG